MTTDELKNSHDSSRIESVGNVPRSLVVAGSVILAAGWTIASVSGGVSPTRLWHAYLLSVCFFLSINLGALFFVILQHLTSAKWSVVTRRVAELLTTTTPVLGLLTLPIVIPMLFGNSYLYEWNDPSLRASDELIQGKIGYLNAPFFAVRCLLYFAVWQFLARFFINNSLRQDDAADIGPTKKMRRFSGPAMILFALTTNFAAFDLLMSLDPHWFSTIFGVYFFAGCAVAFFAALAIATVGLQRSGRLKHEITTEHYHDVSKLLFGFTMFWAYIAFSQYLLIWYANIPEETGWFFIRQRGGWQWVSLSLIVGHFLLPFFGLMSRRARRDRKSLVFWSVVLLVMHWLDLFWLVMPNVATDTVPIGAMEIGCFLGVGTIWLASALRNAVGMRLLPTGDPHLRESLCFHNA